MQYIPGTYEGKAFAVRGVLHLAVSLSEHRIETIEVTKHDEILGQAYGMEMTAFEAFIPKIIQYQSLGIPLITGAEAVCRAILKATARAITLSGADPKPLFEIPVPVPPKKADSSITADIVVFGSGLAGMAAAVEAKLCGADVLLVEKQDLVGGSSCISGGKLMAAGTKMQKALGIEDSPARMFDFLKASAGEFLDDPRIRYFTETAVKNLEWLESLGYQVQDVEASHSSVLPWRIHNSMGCHGQTMGWGGGMILPLYQRFTELGGKLFLHTALKELVTENGRVTGAVAEDTHDGSVIRIRADAVILCTGGFAANRKLVEARYPWMKDYYYNCPEANQGDGAFAAEAVGALNYQHPYLQTMLLNVRSGVGVNEEPGLIVTEEGRRFTNEYQFHSIVGEALAETGFHKAWYLTCGEEACARAPHSPLSYALQLPETCRADSLQALAEQMEVDPGVLEATVARYNQLCALQFDEDFGKPAEQLLALRGPVYYAVPLQTATSITFGGLYIDACAHVMDRDRNVIPGLYAAGEVANTGNFGKAVPSCGYSLGHALHFGRVAARMATGHAMP